MRGCYSYIVETCIKYWFSCFLSKNIFGTCIMPEKMNMQIMNVSRVSRGKRVVHPNISSMPVVNQGRLGNIGSMGMVNRIRHAPAGCSSCGGR